MKSKRRYYSLRRKRFRHNNKTRLIIVIAAGALVIATGAFFLIRWLVLSGGPSDEIASQTGTPTAATAATTSAEATPSPTPEPTLSLDLVPHAIEGETDPDTFGIETHVYVDDALVAGYTRPDPVSFTAGRDYDTLEGVTTYRGTNYRDGASSYGTAAITEEALTVLDIDKTTSAVGSWRGSGCTGQPVIVTWPDALRESMDTLYDDFQHSDAYHDDFTEVIMASLDGNIYFMELSTGIKTRDFIKTGAPVKGTPSLDPRGWPIIYVGQGLNSAGSKTASNDMYFRAYNLIDGSLLFQYGYARSDPDAYRSWQAYDASPLIDAASDTLIWPGESGVLYTVKLNTVYDTAAGTVTMDPGPMVKYTYTTPRNQEANDGKGVWGIENSPVGWRNYLFFTDNVGILQCLDLNTMELVYANDLQNDSDVSMVLEEDAVKQEFYLYTGCEYDDTVVNATSTTGTCYARKIDGLTGKILWTAPFNVNTAIDGNVDGGILASPILGREGTTMEGLIIYTVSGAILDDGTKTSILVALDKETGSVVWQVDLYADLPYTGWTPSSPAAVYTEDGKGYIVQCLYRGTVKLIRVDGKFENGASAVSSVNVGEAMGTEEPNNFEATPAVFGDMIVVGSRSGHFFYIKVS